MLVIFSRAFAYTLGCTIKAKKGIVWNASASVWNSGFRLLIKT